MDPRAFVDFCPKCKGMWLGKGVLARSSGASWDFPDAKYSAKTASVTALKCPFCPSHDPLFKLRYALTSSVEIEACRRCEGIFLDFRELPEVQKVLRAKVGFPAPPVLADSLLKGDEDGADEADDSPLRIGFDSWRANLLALPLAFLFAGLWRNFSLTHFFGWFFLSMPTHEFGHAIAAWLGGRAAIPLPLITPILNAERSGLVYLLVVSGLGFATYHSFRKARFFPVVVCGALILIASYLTWIAPDVRSRMMFTYGGVGGAFILSSFLVASFYYRMPDRVRWDFFRYFALLLGMIVLVDSISFWRQVAAGTAELPVGSAIVGRDDPNGDINQLMTAFGWTPAALVAHFLWLGKACSFVLVGHYIFFLKRAYGKRVADSHRPARVPAPKEVDPFVAAAARNAGRSTATTPAFEDVSHLPKGRTAIWKAAIRSYVEDRLPAPLYGRRNSLSTALLPFQLVWLLTADVKPPSYNSLPFNFGIYFGVWAAFLIFMKMLVRVFFGIQTATLATLFGAAAVAAIAATIELFIRDRLNPPAPWESYLGLAAAREKQRNG